MKDQILDCGTEIERHERSSPESGTQVGSNETMVSYCLNNLYDIGVVLFQLRYRSRQLGAGQDLSSCNIPIDVDIRM